MTLLLKELMKARSVPVDDPFTEGINEGKIGSGMDDPFTKGINEGRIGSGIDDPFTEGVNEGRW